MDCKIVNILLHPYFDGELDEGTAASVKAHLSECVECERELAALQALREATKRAAPRYTAPESLRLRNCLYTQAQRIWSAGGDAVCFSRVGWPWRPRSCWSRA
jgi:anti-sigma factor RsiW